MKVHWQYDTGGMGSALKCKMSEYKVAKSGAEGIVWDWSIAKTGGRGTSQELQSEEKAKGTDGWFPFNGIYSKHYQQ